MPPQTSDLNDLLRASLEDLRGALATVDEGEVATFTAELERASRVFCAGRGGSGLQMQGFAMRLVHLGVPSFVVGDATTPAIGAGDLLLVGSGTATTATLIPIVERARDAGARVALVTANRLAPIARAADAIVTIDAPASHQDPLESGAPALPMGSRFQLSMALLLEVVVVLLMRSRGVTTEAMFDRHANLE